MHETTRMLSAEVDGLCRTEYGKRSEVRGLDWHHLRGIKSIP